ncbi:MAG: GNAT family N-acetyltransferase [Clostridia bacterium]|nr:GNAT family N-acetyltransferase [Clostridia bacterium]
MTEYRFARPEEEAEVLDFINSVFSQAVRPHDFEKLIPKVYAHPGYAPFHAVAVEDGRIRGNIALLPLTVHVGESTLRGGYIGSVSVHPRFRGMGYMKGLMELLDGEARRQGYDFMSLGGQRQRYQHFGFERYGCCYIFSLEQANARHALPRETPFTFVPADESHAAQMALLHRRQALYCERPHFLETLRTYGGVPYAVMNGDAFSGYLVALGNEITELCLADEHDLPAVAAAWLREHKDCAVYCGGQMAERIRGLSAFAESYTVGPFAMLKVLNWENTLRAVMGARPLPDGEKIIRIEGAGAFRLQAENGKAEVLPCSCQPDFIWTETQAVEALFSPLNALLTADPVLRSWLPFTLEIPIADQF